jgi:hypothetical protein
MKIITRMNNRKVPRIAFVMPLLHRFGLLVYHFPSEHHPTFFVPFNRSGKTELFASPPT